MRGRGQAPINTIGMAFRISSPNANEARLPCRRSAADSLEGSTMATPRREVVDPDVPAVYHALSRCVRRAFLFRKSGGGDRRQWVREQLAKVLDCFAFDLHAFAILANHVHLVLANKPDLARSWDPHEVARRWLTLHPSPWLRRRRGVPVEGPPTLEEIEELASDSDRIEELRRRMHDLGWFMKCLKEPIARRANREDNVTGHFWEGRYHAFKIADLGGVVATSAYVDLNEIRAGEAATPEESWNSSASIRADRIMTSGRRELRCGQRRRPPLHERSRLAGPVIRLAPLPGLEELAYLQFLDRSARQSRHGARSIDPRLPPILERLGIDGSSWMRAVRDGLGRLRGSVAGAATSVRMEAARRGRAWLCNALAPLMPTAAAPRPQATAST